jgi:hypothetical protein
MGKVVHLGRHPRGPRVVRVDWIKDNGWVVSTSPDFGGWHCYADDYDHAIVGAAEECVRLGGHPDPSCAHYADIWLALSHLRPEVADG